MTAYMNVGRVIASIIVRVVETGRGETRIVVHDLIGRSVKEFQSWEAALEHLRKRSDGSGASGLR